MKMTHFAVASLRILLVAAFALLLLLQTMSFPGQFAHMAQESPERAFLQWPLTAFAVVELLCAQVVIVSTWKLLTLVRRDRIFSGAATAWVNAIVWAVLVAWTLLFGLFLAVGLTADDPGAPLLLSVFVVGGAVIGLLMLVLRELLRQATTLRTDMEAVI